MRDKFSEGSRLDKRPPHPRGWIGGMIANKLINAGWEYDYRGRFSEMFWWKPDQPDEVYSLEGAHWAEFGVGL